MNKKRLDEIRLGELHATEGTWFSMEDDSCWTIYAQQKGQDVELARCPKGGTQFAEHWPNLVDSMFLTNARQDIPDLLDYVEELKEIEQIYIRSEVDSAREKGRLLGRIDKLKAACREALEASELCGELDEELLREVLDNG